MTDVKVCNSCNKEASPLYNVWRDGQNKKVCKKCLNDGAPKERKVKKGDIEFDGQRLVFADGVYKMLVSTFSDKDVDAERTKASRWLQLPGKKYKDYTRFFWSWLLRAPNKIRSVNENPGRNRPTETPYNPNGPQPQNPKAIDFKSEIERYRPS